MGDANLIRIEAAGMRFAARLEVERAPKTCAQFASMLPLKTHLIQARWSGEAAWIPFGELNLDLGYENHTSHPAPGQLLLYPGGVSETEILFPYGATLFASKMGQLAGNHFATIVEGGGQLAELGRTVLWKGAQDITVFGGGIIPQDDVPKLREMGVAAVFLPGSSTQAIIAWLRANVRPRAAAWRSRSPIGAPSSTKSRT